MSESKLDTLTHRLDRQERENRRLGLAGFAMVLAIPAVVLIVTPTPAAALCIPPVEAANTAPVSYRYAWFLIESLTRASLAWQEADSAADAQDAVTKLAGFKLAIEDFQCAASLVQPFQSTRYYAHSIPREGRRWVNSLEPRSGTNAAQYPVSDGISERTRQLRSVSAR